ncbi:Peptidyl-Lys metalloendopeptidase [Grifola frondosa]|uniref:Peptidyl-Lys metalloendopeptidase n=1 Tax=Grifola frondosa TaxID=5627 RepID=A0A1C7LQW1_GRIFR|nr:Peptidyl-Lys metalloendopeptidase [Grifola frondosa]
MLSLTLITLGITAALSFATPAKRVPALEVSLTAPTIVNSIQDINVTAAVTNTGSDPLKILKYGTVLDSDLPTHSFIVSKDGVTADFTGIRIQVDMDALDDSAFTVIPAGETVVVEHEVAPLYNFEALGTGTYTFEPVTTFQVIEDNAKPNIYKVFASKLTIEIKGDVAKRSLKVRDKRATLSFNR